MRYEVRGDAAWLTFDRPGSANAVTRDVLEEANELLERAAGERAAVLTGAGEHFCAGADLNEVASMEDREEAHGFADALVDLLRGIETAPIPVVAAVNGDAFGAGLEFVVAADLAVAVEGARLGTPAARMGVSPPLTAERVAETAGRKRVAELALTAEPVDSETAADWGVVNRAVEPDELEGEVRGMASSVAATEPEAVRVTKRRISGNDDYDEIEERMTDRLASRTTAERFRDAADEKDG